MGTVKEIMKNKSLTWFIAIGIFVIVVYVVLQPSHNKVGPIETNIDKEETTKVEQSKPEDIKPVDSSNKTLKPPPPVITDKIFRPKKQIEEEKSVVEEIKPQFPNEIEVYRNGERYIIPMKPGTRLIVGGEYSYNEGNGISTDSGTTLITIDPKVHHNGENGIK